MARRIYKANFNGATVGTAVQDIWSILAGASNGIQLHRCDMSASAITTAVQINVRLKRGTATVTMGSGGSTPAKNFADDGDTKASGSTLHANDTTQATTSGNFTGLVQTWQWNLLLPFDYMPGPEDEDRDCCGVAEALIFDLPAVVAAAYVVSSNISWREYP